MDDFKRNIVGYRDRGSKQNVHKGGPCSCCVETDKRNRSRLARRRLRQQDAAADETPATDEEETR